MLKSKKKGLCKALPMLLAVIMLLTAPIGTTQAYALEDGRPVVTDRQSELPLGAGEEVETSEVSDSGAPPYTPDHSTTPDVSSLSMPTTIDVSSELELINRLYLAKNGDTIRLTADIIRYETNSSANYPAITIQNKNITLDLNGKNLSIYNAGFGAALKLETPSPGARNTTQLHVTGGGTLTISSATVGLSVYASKFISDTSVNVDINGSHTVGIGGTLADVDIQNGSVSGSDGITLSHNSNVTVKGPVKAYLNVGVNLSNSKTYPEDTGCVVRVDSIEANGRGISMDGGEVTVDGTITAPMYIQFKGADPTTIGDYLPETTQTGYRTYQHETSGTVWVKGENASENVCEIDGTPYTALSEALEALAAVPSGGTIKLLQDITHTEHITVDEKTINFDLGDYDLLLDTSADLSFSPTLTVSGGGKLKLTGAGTGKFNVKGYSTAIAINGVNSEATADNVEVTGDGNGVRMVGTGDNLDSNGTVTVNGDIKAEKGSGVSLNAKDGKVIVNGNIRAGKIGVELASNPGTEVIVNGDITVTADSPENLYNLIGIRAYGQTAVTVTGNVTVQGTNCLGVHASGSTIQVGGNVASAGEGARSDTDGEVEITGSLTAETSFIIVGTTEKTADQITETVPNFLVYTDGTNTVRIGSVGDAPVASFTVTFNLNGGTRTGGGELTQTVSSSGSATAPTATRSSYTFIGWDKAFDNVTSDLTVTANWSYSGGSDDVDSTPPTSGWLEQSGTSAPIANSKEKGLDYIFTRRNSKYGVRKAAWTALAGLEFWHDTMEDSAVQVRVYVKNPSAITSDLLVSGYVKGPEVDSTNSLFERYFSNSVRTIHLDQTGSWGQAVEIAARVHLDGMDVTKLVFYSYDKATNTYRLIEKPAYWVDTNGYLHFTTQYAGDIVISEGPLTLTENGGAK